MVYLLYGIKEYSIRNWIENLLKKENDININRYDLNNDEIKDVIDDCETYSLFDDKKIVIADNANVFSSSSNNGADIIVKYLENINTSTILIFILHAEKIDSRKKISNLIKNKGKVLEFNDEIDLHSLIKSELKDYNIEYKDINLIIDRVGHNPQIIKNEINKIILYKDNDKNITSEDIINITTKSLDIDIFKLIDYIITNNKEGAIEIYNNMLSVNEEPIKIVIMLANQFRIMYQSKQLMIKGYSEKEIAATLKIHPYRVKLAFKNGRRYTAETLLKYIDELAKIDIGIKSGKMNKDLALELFILKQ